MKLKQTPEDFIVREVPGFHKSEGSYVVALMKKTNYTTEKAIQTICKNLHLQRKRVGYAGIKDKAAVTEQYISIKNFKKEKLESLFIKDIELEFVSYSDTPISLGTLKGNDFEIVVRDLDKSTKINSDIKIKNFFDEQRFLE